MERAPWDEGETDIAIAILIDHPKIFEAIRGRVVVVGPNYAPVRVKAHIVLDDPKHRAKPIDVRVRMALVELGMVDPNEVGFTYPEQVSLGWPEQKD